MSNDLQRLSALLDRLDSTPVQGSLEARRKNKVFSRTAISRMFDGGGTFGEAAGTMPWLNGPDAVQKLRALKDDLGAQIGMVNHILDNWFKHGEPVAPGYPFRIAVILRKMKRADLESDFLRAFGRHFISHHYGARSADLGTRMEKVLGEQVCEELWAASEALEERPVAARGVRKLGVFPRHSVPIAGSATARHFTFEFLCKRCGGRNINIPDGPDEGDMVTCSSCKVAFGPFPVLNEYCNWLALEKMEDDGS